MSIWTQIGDALGLTPEDYRQARQARDRVLALAKMQSAPIAAALREVAVEWLTTMTLLLVAEIRRRNGKEAAQKVIASIAREHE